MRNLILGTAGHIDHGKTSLVRALTGVNTDRLPEEQRRGMTIELGFADFSEGDLHFGIVDVPGHERFVRTMVAGATGVDLTLLVIAADDSVMPQTVEHVEILDLLGMRHGVVALTKIDMVDPSLVELAADEVGQLLASTSLSEFPIIPVSSMNGQGLPELRQALVEQARLTPDRDTDFPFRLGIDRVFTVPGRGTVVTGSVYSGRVQHGDRLELWPGPLSCLARGLQTHGLDSGQLQVGQRAAINISGLVRAQIERGYELAAEGALMQSQTLDVRLTYLRSNRRPLPSHKRIRLCMGTRECQGQVIFLDAIRQTEPGQSAFAQLRTSEPVVAVHGQRFIIRDENARRTLGGGIVLRSISRRRTLESERDRSGLHQLYRGSDSDRLAETLRYAMVDPTNVPALCTHAGIPISRIALAQQALENANAWINVPGTLHRVFREHWEQWERRACQYLERFHRLHPGEVGCPIDTLVGWMDRRSQRGCGRPLVNALAKAGRIKQMGAYVCLARFAPALSAQDEKTLTAMLALFESGGFQPPGMADVISHTRATTDRLQKLLRLALATRQLVEVAKDLYLHSAADEKLHAVVTDILRTRQTATVSEIKDALGTSRKFAVPFVEYLDRTGFTVREGDARRLRSP